MNILEKRRRYRSNRINALQNTAQATSEPPRSTINHELESTPQPQKSSQLLINGSFELWEDAKSLVVWKGENISREVNSNNVRTGRTALRMPANSSIYQFISSNLRPYTLYEATLYVRIDEGKAEVKNEVNDGDKPGDKTPDDVKAKSKPKPEVKEDAKDEVKTMNVPLIASISFFNALGDPIGYKTQIIVDPFNVGTKYEAFKVLVEPPDKAETARLTLSIPASDEGDNSYL